MTVTAVVPARNEGARIADTVRALKKIKQIDDIIVVDDASTDTTADAAHDAGASVLLLRRRVGKGSALRAGLARTHAADVVLFIDGDLGSSASIASTLLEPILAGEADMSIAVPPPDAPSGFGLVERFARAGILRLAGRAMSRPLSGQRAVRRAVLDGTKIASGFGVEVALTIDALRAGFRVEEIPASFDHAYTGRNVSGFLHRARQGLDVALAFLSRLVVRGSRP